MDNKSKIKEVLLLTLCVGIIVPVWGTFHTIIGIKAAWAAYASAALFFATGHKLKDSLNVAVAHAIGVGWGMAVFILPARQEFSGFDSRVVFFSVLCFLGVMAVVVTNMGVKLFSHLPSLFCGWAVTVGALGGIPLNNWGYTPLDVMLSLVAGVFIVGVGISQLHVLLMKLFKINQAVAKKDVVKKDNDESNNIKPKMNLTEAKMNKFLTTYKSESNEVKENNNGELFELKREIINLRNTLSSGSVGISNGESYLNTPVKIVGICGSPHKKGSTVVYLRKALEAAESIGNVSTELIELAGKDIKPCMGCKTDKCYGKCKINDAMQEIYPILQNCDGIILGSPSYFGTFSGQLKVFIDRLRVMRHTDFQLGNKVVAPLSVAGRRHGGQEITNLDLVQAMMRHNTIVVNDGTAVCQLGATGWSHTFDDPNSTVEDDVYGLETAEGVGKRVAEIAKVIKSSGLQKTIYKYNATIGKR